MGLSSTTWFVIAVIIVLLGVGLLFVDRKQQGEFHAEQERTRFAEARARIDATVARVTAAV